MNDQLSLDAICRALNPVNFDRTTTFLNSANREGKINILAYLFRNAIRCGSVVDCRVVLACCLHYGFSYQDINQHENEHNMALWTHAFVNNTYPIYTNVMAILVILASHGWLQGNLSDVSEDVVRVSTAELELLKEGFRFLKQSSMTNVTTASSFANNSNHTTEYSVLFNESSNSGYSPMQGGHQQQQLVNVLLPASLGGPPEVIMDERNL